MAKGSVYYWYGGSLLLLEHLDANMHRHYPVELYVGLDDAIQIDLGDGWQEHHAVIVNSQQPHAIMANRVALLLYDPKLYHLSMSDPIQIPSDTLITSMTAMLDSFSSQQRSCQEAQKLTDTLWDNLFNRPQANPPMDPRITFLLSNLENIIDHRITAKDLARSVDLSESRLAHLFKDATGTPIRRFLRWLRLRKAIKLVLEGKSLTTAAHASGFSDSAHLSRTYRDMFGIPPSDLLKSQQNIDYTVSFK